MRKILLALVLGFVFIGGGLYAADGDLKVYGKIGYVTSGDLIGKLDLQSGSDINGSGGSHIALQYNTGGYRHWIRTRHAAGAITGNAFDFYTNTGSTAGASTAPGVSSVHGLTIDNGNVGVGTTSPAKRLHIYETSATNAAAIKVQTHNASYSALLWLHQSGSANGKEWYIASRSTGELAIGNIAGGAADRIFISPTGNVGINSPNPPNLLQMETSGGGYYSTSDHHCHDGSSGRWKSDIKPITGALDTVLKLNGVSFKWKQRTDTFEDGIDGTKQYVSSSWKDNPNAKDTIGLIAEDVMKVLPEVVAVDPKDSNFASGIAYSKIVALLIEAIKEQQREIVKLKEDLEALKK